jgi:hypothetical protein
MGDSIIKCQLLIKKIGKKIRDLQKARDWTQEALAEKSGLG